MASYQKMSCALMDGIFRKTAFGSKSENGMDAHSVPASLEQTKEAVSTSEKFSRNSPDLLTPTAISHLYNNSG